MPAVSTAPRCATPSPTRGCRTWWCATRCRRSGDAVLAALGGSEAGVDTVGGDSPGARRWPPGASGKPPVFEPATLGPLTLKNRIIKAATFEGATPRGEVTDELIAFHLRVADGGAAMTTVAYLAVSPEGRTDRHCVLPRRVVAPRAAPADRPPSTMPGLPSRPRSATPGRWPTAVRTGRPSLAPSRRLSPSGAMTRAATDGDIDRITDDYRRGAEMAVDCRVRLHRGPPRAQLPAQRLPEPEAQPPHRSMGRQPGQPSPLPPPGGRGRP